MGRRAAMSTSTLHAVSLMTWEPTKHGRLVRASVTCSRRRSPHRAGVRSPGQSAGNVAAIGGRASRAQKKVHRCHILAALHTAAEVVVSNDTFRLT